MTPMRNPRSAKLGASRANFSDPRWRCLLEGPLRTRAEAIVHEILGAIADVREIGCGLEGAGGRGCLLIYAGQVHADDELLRRGKSELEACFEAVGEASLTVGLWGGLADVRFLSSHLGGDRGAGVLRVVDAVLAEVVDDGSLERIDFVGGLAGVGAMALAGGGTGHALAGAVVRAFESGAQSDAGGVTWFTPPELLPASERDVCPEGYFNLGLSHGIPGVIGFLARALSAGVEPERSRRLLDGAVPWLLAVAPPGTPARFPQWRGTGASSKPARLAWCYGDAGVVMAILAAARATGNSSWEEEARGMARAMATRPFEGSGVVDTGLCHGAAGVAHVFNRLYQATGDEIVATAARDWFGRLLDMRRPGEAVAGFPSLELPDGKEVWVPDAGVLLGATGVALALLAATSTLEPSWDRVLLCDVAPDPSAPALDEEPLCHDSSE
jgi:hypothetical protein